MSNRAVIIDITRLATRFSRRAPNGIDRVDIGYAAHYLSNGGLGAIMTGGLPRAIANLAARRLVSAINSHWRENGATDNDPAFARLKTALSGGGIGTMPPVMRHRNTTLKDHFVNVTAVAGMMPGANLVKTAPEKAAYLNISQFPLWSDRCFRWLSQRRDIRAFFFIHDLLPLQYPEFFPPSELRRHAARLDVVAKYAAGVIVSSEETKNVLANELKQRSRSPIPILVNPLPVTDHFLAPTEADPDIEHVCYFVSVGTIEPRKNQLLLLQIWRELAETLREATPKLILVGGRGWDNENIVDMLDRCPAVAQHVIAVANLSTPALRKLLASCRAVLMPSFAEGYGLPVAEASAANVPVIAADISCFRELNAQHVKLIDPLNGPEWRDTVIALSSRQRLKFIQKLSTKRADLPSWQMHMEHTDQFIESIID